MIDRRNFLLSLASSSLFGVGFLEKGVKHISVGVEVKVIPTTMYNVGIEALQKYIEENMQYYLDAVYHGRYRYETINPNIEGVEKITIEYV